MINIEKMAKDMREAFDQQMRLTSTLAMLGKHTPKERRAEMLYDVAFAAMPFIVYAIARSFAPGNRMIEALVAELIPIEVKYVSAKSVEELTEQCNAEKK